MNRIVKTVSGKKTKKTKKIICMNIKQDILSSYKYMEKHNFLLFYDSILKKGVSYLKKNKKSSLS